MPYTTLINPNDLAPHLTDSNWTVIDCRFDLVHPEKGRQDYALGHIAGAFYAHLDEDLSGMIIPAETSRHPLPDVDTWVQTLSQWGIDSEVQVVVYDDQSGAIAARLWWMLKWMGHEAVAVLDGGWSRWQREGYAERNQVETYTPRQFIPDVQDHLLATTNDVLKMTSYTDPALFDSRDAKRYHGEHEPIDPVAGHIPKAICVPFVENIGPNGQFLTPAELESRFRPVLKDRPVHEAVFYCGSGVTAAHNILAMAQAGLGQARLYAGSWSEWITDSNRPIETS